MTEGPALLLAWERRAVQGFVVWRRRCDVAETLGSGAPFLEASLRRSTQSVCTYSWLAPQAQRQALPAPHWNALTSLRSGFPEAAGGLRMNPQWAPAPRQSWKTELQSQNLNPGFLTKQTPTPRDNNDRFPPSLRKTHVPAQCMSQARKLRKAFTLHSCQVW